jgi:ATP-dependent RNA helicase DDX19/DBP5
MNFSRPSKVQEQALPVLLKDPPQHVICQAKSGDGKTISYVLTMLQRIKEDVKATQSLCAAPTRELARQLYDVTKRLGRFTGITVGLVIKDTSLKEGPMNQKINIGTPGALLFALKRRIVQTSQLNTFVLDEADTLLEKESLGDQCIRVRKLVESQNFQILLFSATYSLRKINYCRGFAPGAREMTLEVECIIGDNIVQLFMDCESLEHKFEVLGEFYNFLNVSQSIIFCRTRTTAEKISERMIKQGHHLKFLHAGLTPDERDVVIDEFRRGVFKVLISTNVVSRGIDISQISLVINYDLPTDMTDSLDMDVYVHRVGGTGRFGRQGIIVSFIHDQKSYEQVQFIETILG